MSTSSFGASSSRTHETDPERCGICDAALAAVFVACVKCGMTTCGACTAAVTGVTSSDSGNAERCSLCDDPVGAIVRLSERSCQVDFDSATRQQIKVLLETPPRVQPSDLRDFGTFLNDPDVLLCSAMIYRHP